MIDNIHEYVIDKMNSDIWSNYDGTSSLKYKQFKVFETLDDLKDEINDILNLELDNNLLPYCCTLYDVIKMSNTCFEHFHEMKSKYLKELNDIVKNVYGNNCDVNIGEFHSRDKSLKLYFKYISGDYDRIIISKKNDQLYIKETETNKAEELLYHFDNKLVKLYDEYQRYMQSKNKINAINCSCLVDINEVGLGITITFKFKDIDGKIKFLFINCSNDKYISSSDDILLDVDWNEFLKRIYIQIKDCPSWMKNDLCMQRLKEIRMKKQQDEQSKQMEQQNLNENIEDKKQSKHKVFVKKIFSFFK